MEQNIITPDILIPKTWQENTVFSYHTMPTPYLTLKKWENIPWLKHGFSTRWGGVSQGIYANMNLGFKTADQPENIRKNYEIICAAIGLNTPNLTLTDQTHSTNVKIITEKDIGKGFSIPQDFHDVDGLITDIPLVPLSVVHADCVPLLFVDMKQKVVGAAHAGWRGTVNGIATTMIQTFLAHFHSQPEDIWMGIGPSIGFCCYEVDTPVMEVFANHPLLANTAVIKPTAPGKYHIHLQEVNRILAQAEGILQEHMIDSNLCTNCHKDLFFSHRGHKGKRGLLASLIQIDSCQ